MKIIVTGSLGHIGKPLATELAKKGHEVTVISSDADKKQTIESLNATAAIGSLSDADFLTKTFSSADAVFAMVPPNYTSGDQMEYYRNTASNYIQAIKASGVKRVVHLSSYGAHLPEGTGMIKGSHIAEELLNQLNNVAVTHLRPGYFYYNLLNFIPMVKGMGSIGSNYGGDDKLVLVATKDIAAAAAEELQKTGDIEKVRYVASDERTCNQIAEVLGNAVGKPDLKWLVFSDEQTKEGMTKNGMPGNIADVMVEMGAALHQGILQTDYNKHKPAVFGQIKLEDFANKFAEDYNKA